jgi:septal ring factor EnvC (AmiA/AmiB activator)
MLRGNHLAVLIVVTTLGLWGCAQGNSATAQAERIHALETRCSKLEDDYRAAVTVRDQARKKTTSLEEQLAQLQKDSAAQQETAKEIVKERNELRQIVESRTSERDLLQTRCERLKKGLQNLLGQDDAMTTGTNPPVTTTSTTLAGQS